MAASTSPFLEQLIPKTKHAKPTDCSVRQHSRRPNVSSSLQWFAFKDLRPPLAARPVDAGRMASRSHRPTPRPPELFGARSQAHEEVAASSPSANWFSRWQQLRGGSASGAHDGARGSGTRRGPARTPPARTGVDPAVRAPDEKGTDPIGACTGSRSLESRLA